MTMRNLTRTGAFMAIVKRPLTKGGTAQGWQLVFDIGRKELYVEDGNKRLSVDAAMQMDGKAAIELQSAIVDLFKLQPGDVRIPTA